MYKRQEKEYLDACIAYGIAHPVGMCYQDAGWKYGPWIGSGDSIRNNSVYVTWREYFERVTDGRSSDDYRMPQEDVRVSLMWGSQVLPVSYTHLHLVCLCCIRPQALRPHRP